VEGVPCQKVTLGSLRLGRAIELDKALRKLALDDEDLKPLWDWIATPE
jgi:hypothetical protein